MGIILLFIGLGVLVFGLMQHLKGKRILAAPFKKTGELAKNPVSEDPKGAMSTEGKVVPPATTLLSPCTKQPCLYYEVKIERLYEKTETTQDGTKTVSGSDTLETVKDGALFGLDDGSGVFQIDVSKGADFDNMKDGYKKELNGRSWASSIQFGEFNYQLPAISEGKTWTIGFKATERYVPVDGNLFVLGKIDGGKLTKPGWRSMLASNKGREGLLGSIQKKKKFSFIGGGIAAVLSIPAFIFAPKADPNAVSAYCESSLTDTRARCGNTVTSKSGDDYTWTVTKAGEYSLEVFAPNKTISLAPEIIVKNAAGEILADEMGPTAGTATATVKVQPGVHTIVVKPADDYMVSGGFSYDLEIRGDKTAAPGAADPAVAAIPSGEVQKFDAPILATEFLKNASSLAKYDGATLEVKGVLATVDVDVDFSVVAFEVPMAEKFNIVANLPAKAKVKAGQLITVRGTAVFDEENGMMLISNAELVGTGNNTALAPAGGKKGKKKN